jgi:hypothetical protein
MYKELLSLIPNCSHNRKCCATFKEIDSYTKFMLLTPSMLGYVISEEARPCIIMDNPPYGDLIMPGFPIRPSNHVASAKFVENSFKIEETKILCKIPGTGVNKGYWKIKILYIFTFNIEFFNCFGRKLKVCHLNSSGNADECSARDYIEASTKYIQTAILSGPNDCVAKTSCEDADLKGFKEQSYPFIKVNSDAIPFDIKVTPIKKDDCECNCCPDPYKDHEVEIDVSIILNSCIKLFGFKKVCHGNTSCNNKLKIVIKNINIYPPVQDDSSNCK